ncbi:MAG: hypothetical protein LBQ23_01130 [Puniceicoccales bacterium]|nr:hypothetical protein [Puniceicoccales bacterium]
MKTDITSILQRFQSLPIKQKTISVALLGLTSLVLVCLVIILGMSFPKKIRQIASTYTEQKVWFAQSADVEKDLSDFAKSGTGHKKQDLQKIAAVIEKITAKIGVNYTITEIEKGHIEKLTIHRHKVTFNGIPLSGLIEFFKQIEELDSNVAISETRIDAQGQLLNAYCIISILDTE